MNPSTSHTTGGSLADVVDSDTGEVLAGALDRDYAEDIAAVTTGRRVHVRAASS